MKEYRLFKVVLTVTIAVTCLFFSKVNTSAGDVPRVALSYDEKTQTVTISNVEFHDSDNESTYELHATLYYSDGTLVEAVSISEDIPYDNYIKKSYDFSWKEKEFILPESGKYTFKAWLTSYNNETGAKNGRGAIESLEIEYKLSSEDVGWYSTDKKEKIDEEECIISKDPVLTIEKLAELKSSDMNLRIKCEGYQWTVKGSSILHVPTSEINLETKFELGSYTKRDIKKEFGEIDYIPISITHDGLFGFDAELEFEIPKGNAERFANLFYVPGSGVFSYVESMEIPETNIVAFTFVHASDYLITITDEPYDPYVGADIIEKKIKTIEDSATPMAAGIAGIYSTRTYAPDGEYADTEIGAILDEYSFYNPTCNHKVGVCSAIITLSAIISYLIIRKKIKSHKITLNE